MSNNFLEKDKSPRELTVVDFEGIFGERLSDYVKNKVSEYKFLCYDVDLKEHDYCVKRIIETLLDENIIKAGEHRKEQWEKGWAENLEMVDTNFSFEAMIPKYFNKYDFARLNQKFIKPISKHFEYNMLKIILDWIFDKYIRNTKNIYEFGCGTGYHLLHAREINKDANLWGLDWTEASQRLIEKLRINGIDKNIFGHRFDYFNPDMSFNLESDAVVYTVASLEQVGSNFIPFVNYLLDKKPKLCINIEPIAELLDENNLLDYLSIEYFKKRNYLDGFLKYLYELQDKGEIKIHNAQRTFIGSFFIEGYSVVVWSPV